MSWEQISGFFWVIGVPVLLILAVTLWVFRPGSRKRYEQDAEIPFDDEDEKGAGPHQPNNSRRK